MKLRTLLLSAVLSVSFVGGAYAQSTCTKSGGVITHPGVGNVCWTEPDMYELTIYEMALCTTSPSAPTASSSLGTSNCTTIFSNSSGSTVQITGGTGTAPSGLFTRPPEDTYTHGYLVVDKDFAVEAAVQFSGSVTADGGGSGVYCSTQTGSAPTVDCAGAAAAAGTLAVATTTFDGGGFDPSTTASFTGSSGGSVTMNAYLIDSSNNLAASSGVVDKVIGVQTFATPVVITESSSSFTLAINVSNGMTVVDTAGTTSLLNGPFRVDLSVR